MWSRGSSRHCCRNCSNPGLNKQFLRDGFYWKLWNHQGENRAAISHYTLTHWGFVVSYFYFFCLCTHHESQHASLFLCLRFLDSVRQRRRVVESNLGF